MADEPAPPVPQPAAPRSGSLRRVFVEGTIGSAIVAVAVWFLTPSDAPHLTLKVSPSRSVIVTKSDVGGLRVLHGEQEIKGDVTAVQVSLWNEGHGPARGSTVLEPVSIVTEPRTQILSASVQKVTRPLCEVSLDSASLASGIVPVRFKILERGDGALVQLVYAGPPSVRVIGQGVLEGQRSVENATEKKRDSLFERGGIESLGIHGLVDVFGLTFSALVVLASFGDLMRSYREANGTFRNRLLATVNTWPFIWFMLGAAPWLGFLVVRIIGHPVGSPVGPFSL